MDKFNLTQTGQEIQNDLNFVDDEYKKTLNLFNIYDGILDSGIYYKINIPNKIGTYTISLNITAYSIEVWDMTSNPNVQLFDVNASQHTYNITDGSKKYAMLIRISGNADYVTPSNYSSYNIMLNEGSVALPYQPYNGSVIHKSDIEPVLLWTNTNPDAQFAGGDLSLPNLDSYKYVILKWKYYQSDSAEYVKVVNEYHKSFHLTKSYNTDGYWEMARRSFEWHSSMVRVSSGYYWYGSSGGSANNSYCIPLAIYGTNIL